MPQPEPFRTPEDLGRASKAVWDNCPVLHQILIEIAELAEAKKLAKSQPA